MLHLVLFSLSVASAAAACACPSSACWPCVMFNASSAEACGACSVCFQQTDDGSIEIDNDFALVAEDCSAKGNKESPGDEYLGTACESKSLQQYAPSYCKQQGVTVALTSCGAEAYVGQVGLCAESALADELSSCEAYFKGQQLKYCLGNETELLIEDIASAAAVDISDTCRDTAVLAQEQLCFDNAAAVQNDGCIADARVTIAQANIIAYATHFGGIVELAQAYSCDNSGKTYEPTGTTSAPTASTTTPTVTSKVPTVRTSAPSAVTTTPTIRTKSPTGAPTKTQAPTIVTASPTSVAPTGTPTSGAPTGTPTSKTPITLGPSKGGKYPTGAPTSVAPTGTPTSGTPTSVAPTSCPTSKGPTYAKDPTKAPTSKHPTGAPTTPQPTGATKAPTIRTKGPTGIPTSKTKVPTSTTVTPTIRSKVPTRASKAPTKSPTKTPTARTKTPTSSPTNDCQSKANQCKLAFIAQFTFADTIIDNSTLNSTLDAANCLASSVGMYTDFYYQVMTCYLNNETCADANVTAASVTGVYASETKQRLDAAGDCADDYTSSSCEQFGLATDKTTSEECYDADTSCKGVLTAGSFNQSVPGECDTDTISTAIVCNTEALECNATFYRATQIACTTVTETTSEACVLQNTACDEYFNSEWADDYAYPAPTSSLQAKCEENGSGAWWFVLAAAQEVKSLVACMSDQTFYTVACPTTAQNTSRYGCLNDYLECNETSSKCYDETKVELEVTCPLSNLACQADFSNCLFNTDAKLAIDACQGPAAMCTTNYITQNLTTMDTNTYCNETTIKAMDDCIVAVTAATGLITSTEGACTGSLSMECAGAIADKFGGSEYMLSTVEDESTSCTLNTLLCESFITTGGFLSGGDSDLADFCAYFQSLDQSPEGGVFPQKTAGVNEGGPYETLEDWIEEVCVEDKNFKYVETYQVWSEAVSKTKLSTADLDLFCDDMIAETASLSKTPVEALKMICNQTETNSSRRRLLEEEPAATNWIIRAYMKGDIVAIVSVNLEAEGLSAADVAEAVQETLKEAGIEVEVEVYDKTPPPTPLPLSPTPAPAPTTPEPTAPPTVPAATPTAFSASRRLAPSLIALSAVLAFLFVV